MIFPLASDLYWQKFVWYEMLNHMRRPGLAVAIATILALPTAPSAAQSAPRFDRAVELASFDSAWTRVRDSYYDPSMGGLNWLALRDSLRPQVERGRSRDDTRQAITTLLSRLGESHFGVLPGEAMDAGASANNGVAGDAGIEGRFIDSALVITRVDSGTPAHSMGIRPGWIIDEIDSVRVLDALRATSLVGGSARRFALVRLTLNLNSRLSGPSSGTIRLLVRDARNSHREMKVPLRESPGQVVEYGSLPPMHVRFESRRLTSATGCVGLIRFNIFMTPVMPRFEDAMTAMRDCTGVVLDLRGNLGGLGAMVMGISGHYFTAAETLGTMRIREATMRYVANPVRVSRSGQPLEPFDGQVAIVIDELSASTTEILAAALQRLGRARVFGSPSAGQALPALITTLPNRDRLMYVIGDFAGPGGTRLEGAGVIPDVRVPLSRSALLAGRDEALLAAYRWVEIPGRRRGGSK
jgi:carboxyl-terminal processing protease